MLKSGMAVPLSLIILSSPVSRQAAAPGIAPVLHAVYASSR